VYRDYLRDYLAARRAVLVISVIGDRFANLSPEAERLFENRELEPLDEGTVWLTTVVHPAQDTTEGRTMVRGTLYWNVMVPPYERPKSRRSPWPRFFNEEEDDETVPRFFADAEGRRARLHDHDCPRFLFFKAQVLEKYLGTTGYTVEFHMRTWGRAQGPRYDSGIDVGINSRGLVTAFTGDLERLEEQELLHWAHYSSMPVGEVCSDLFQTRMMNNPPNAPAVPEILREAREATNLGFLERFGASLVRESELSTADRARVSIGPIRGDDQELCDLAVPLYEWLVASMQLSALRAPLDAAGCRYDERAGQFSLLNLLLTRQMNVPEDEARTLLSPLQGARSLRIAAAHRVERDLLETFAQMGVSVPFATTRDAWNWLVDSIAASLRSLGQRFRVS